MKKKLAIVSSYGELCGIATYAEALVKGFSKHFEVKVFALPVKLLNDASVQAKILSKRILEQFAKELKEYDYVNIQFEKGLFGLINKDIYNNFLKVASVCPRTIVTLHSYNQKSSVSNRATLKHFLGLRIIKGLKEFIHTFKNNYYAGLDERILTFCEKKNISVVVHTPREKFLLSLKFPQLKVSDNPISFLNKEMLENYKATTDRQAFLEKYGFNENDIVIGIFGFISEYKGHHTAIKALPYLPPHYKLAIFGAQHPASIQPGILTDPYINSLLELILKPKSKSSNKEKLKLRDRVKFCGALDDDEFVKALLCCDYTILPYFETHQSGSGVACLSLETGSKVILSQNHAFLELSKYAKNAFKMFSIGNYIELADCISSFNAPLTSELNAYFEKYNLDTLVQFYIQHFESDFEEK